MIFISFSFFQKVGIELIVDKGTFTEHQCVNAIVANDCIELPSEDNNALFKLGLVDYVLKHGNQKECVCYSCFPTRYVLNRQKLVQLVMFFKV